MSLYLSHFICHCFMSQVSRIFTSQKFCNESHVCNSESSYRNIKRIKKTDAISFNNTCSLTLHTQNIFISVHDLYKNNQDFFLGYFNNIPAFGLATFLVFSRLLVTVLDSAVLGSMSFTFCCPLSKFLPALHSWSPLVSAIRLQCLIYWVLFLPLDRVLLTRASCVHMTLL